MNIDRVPCKLRPTHLAVEGYLTCDPCSSRMRDALDDVVRLFPKVDHEVHSDSTSGDGGPRGSTVYQSGPPINLARIDRAQRLGQAHVAEILSSWADNVCEDTGQSRHDGYSVSGAATVLVRMWSWIRRQYWVGDFASELFDLQRTLQQLAGETRGRIPLGLCPQPVDYNPRTGARIYCEQRLYARPDDRAVHCPQCSATWPAYRWNELHTAQAAA